MEKTMLRVMKQGTLQTFLKGLGYVINMGTKENSWVMKIVLEVNGTRHVPAEKGDRFRCKICSLRKECFADCEFGICVGIPGADHFELE
jgi:hypothetical protein